MPLLKKLLKGGNKKATEAKENAREVREDEERPDDNNPGRDGGGRATDEERGQSDGTKLVYFALESPRQDILDLLQTESKDVHVSLFLNFIFYSLNISINFYSSHLPMKRNVLNL
jgi:hypothetical protein